MVIVFSVIGVSADQRIRERMSVERREAERRADSFAVATIESQTASPAAVLAADRHLHTTATAVRHAHSHVVAIAIDSVERVLKQNPDGLEELEAMRPLLAFVDSAGSGPQASRLRTARRRLELRIASVRRHEAELSRGEFLDPNDRRPTNLTLLQRVALKCGLSEKEVQTLAARGSAAYQRFNGIAVSPARMLRLLDEAVPIDAAPVDCDETAATIVALTGSGD
jgi:hypothetical protein